MATERVHPGRNEEVAPWLRHNGQSVEAATFHVTWHATSYDPSAFPHKVSDNPSAPGQTHRLIASRNPLTSRRRRFRPIRSYYHQPQSDCPPSFAAILVAARTGGFGVRNGPKNESWRRAYPTLAQHPDSGPTHCGSESHAAHTRTREPDMMPICYVGLTPWYGRISAEKSAGFGRFRRLALRSNPL